MEIGSNFVRAHLYHKVFFNGPIISFFGNCVVSQVIISVDSTIIKIVLFTIDFIQQHWLRKIR